MLQIIYQGAQSSKCFLATCLPGKDRVLIEQEENINQDENSNETDEKDQSLKRPHQYKADGNSVKLANVLGNNPTLANPGFECDKLNQDNFEIRN